MIGRWVMGSTLCLTLASVLAFAGGPMLVGSPQYGQDGEPMKWDSATMPIHYRVDPGPLSSRVTNATARTRVATMFGKWSGAGDTVLSFKDDNALLANGAYTAGADVTTLTQYNAVMDSCDSGKQSPVIFDASGLLLTGLGYSDLIIGMAGPCNIDTAGRIKTGSVYLNGKWQDGINSSINGELTTGEFDEAITHEIGHFLGLDHSQINVQVLSQGCTPDLTAGLPLMFPFSACGRTDSGFPMMSADDAAWISWMYPAATRSQHYGKISGHIYFSDGTSQAQGVNVIARRVNDPSTPQDESLRIAVSAVSGNAFTTNPGQSVTANYLKCKVASDCPPNGYLGYNVNGSVLGSRQVNLLGYYEIDVPPGTYTIEVESISPAFEAGSSVGPFSRPVPLPGPPEFWNDEEAAADDINAKTTVTVGAGESVTNKDIILNSTPPRFDGLEDSGEMMWHRAPLGRWHVQWTEVRA